tara:strand:+ start:7773 stop:8204 length:432 start_codon:yes stop_codon:yes gene_type:complete
MSFDLRIRNGDIGLNSDGSVKIVDNNTKLRQDIVKILLTDTGSNKFHKFYGSRVGALEIGGVADRSIIDTDLEASVRRALSNLISMQKAQSRKQFITPGEKILEVTSVSVERDQADPRLYNVFISVLTQKLSTISEVITIRIV